MEIDAIDWWYVTGPLVMAATTSVLALRDEGHPANGALLVFAGAFVLLTVGELLSANLAPVPVFAGVAAAGIATALGLRSYSALALPEVPPKYTIERIRTTSTYE
jgi:hypothetical protein